MMVVGTAWLAGVLPALAGMALHADEPARASPEGKPPWQRLLQGAEARQAAEHEKQLAQLQEAGKFEEALKVAEALAELRVKEQGADHWQAANARWEVEALRRVLRQRGEGRTDYAKVSSLERQANTLKSKGRYKEAQPLLEKILAICRKVLGEEHPHTAQSFNNLAYNLNAQGKYAQAAEGYRKALAIRRKALGEEHPDTATSYNNLAMNLNAQGKYAQAEEGLQKALAIRRKVLGEEHPHTALSYNNVAYNLQAQGKYAQAEEGFRKALAIRRKVLGEEHPDTAASYNNVAGNLDAQGRYAEAAEGYRKALAITRKVLGEEHPDTATCYNNLAANLQDQGKYAEAAEGYRTALAICRKALGEEHPHTALTYNNLAANLQAQGRYPEAAEGFRKALAIRRKVLGEEHPDTADSYNNVAYNLNAQGKYAQAEEGYRKALAIRRKVLGEEHPDTAQSYHNLAYNLNAQGKYAEAADGFRKALDIYRKVLGEKHPDTATSYNNVAANLHAQGKYAQAAEGFRKALDIRRQALGEEHPHTAISYNNLAANLHAQGKYAEAEDCWSSAADSFASARLRIAPSGLDRATITGEASPLFPLAAILARNGKPDKAWLRFEQSLARGTWDDLSARLRRPPADQARQTELSNRLDRLDRLIENTLSGKGDTPDLKKRREDLLTERRRVQDELDAFARHLEKAYGPAAGQVFERQQIQASLPADAALLGWLDIPASPKAADPDGEHWAVLLRATGAPVWVRLRGTGPQGAWTEADTRLPYELWTALQSSRGAWRPLAQGLRQQRLDPLAKHLPAVRHLIVLPSTALGPVPVEIITDGHTVSYALSGTLHAHLRRQPRPTTRGLLALADPVFDPPASTDKTDRPSPLPPGGVLLTMVAPGSNAALSGLRPNDVLLRYHDTDLSGPADVKLLPASDDPDRRVTVTVWRDGRTFERKVRPGKLGVVLAGAPAPQALAEQRQLDRRLLASTRGGDKWPPLPGTRAEVEALRRLFGGEPAPKLLCDSQASEQQLDELARGGELDKYRYLHLATHGVVDDRAPLRSAVMLSRDALPDPQQQLEANRPVYDGQLTAREVLEQWHLSAELVTLSACQTALGKYERGEGFVGFAQALILSGSRSVCLSLWKVDDAATALLMERFYQNLLGKRDGLKGPMPKAAALREAKQWLRTLPREEAVRRAASLSGGVARGKGRPVLPLLPQVPAAPPGAKEDRPYAHPYYWAAFVLLGDPG
jgi:tetratricopeptide (TPR) repeat protein